MLSILGFCFLKHSSLKEIQFSWLLGIVGVGAVFAKLRALKIIPQFG